MLPLFFAATKLRSMSYLTFYPQMECLENLDQATHPLRIFFQWLSFDETSEATTSQ